MTSNRLFLIAFVAAFLTGCPKKKEPECEKYDNGNCKVAMLPDEDAPTPPIAPEADSATP